jgi:hypothetical protein
MLSRPRLGTGEIEVPPEALVEPSLGHAVVQGGVNIVFRVASFRIREELLPRRSAEAELKRGGVSLSRGQLRAR